MNERTPYVFTVASIAGPVARFFYNTADLAAYARGFAERWPAPLLYVSQREVRAA